MNAVKQAPKYAPFLSPIYKILEKKACFSSGYVPSDSIDIKPDAKEISFLMFGDFGSGNDDQRRVSLASAKSCEKHGCDFVLLLGDNFIQKGVSGLDDPQFQSKFEDMYPHDLPFYAILGNHDLCGNWRAQIEYSEHSKRWIMPDVDYSFQAGPMELLGINTSCTVRSLWSIQRPKRKAWRLVFGHRPLVSAGRHRSMNWLEKRFILSAKPDFYCSGHNHVLEHLKWHGIDQITSGGGGSPIHHEDLDTKAAEYLHEGFGYSIINVTMNYMEVLFYDDQGNKLYEYQRHI